MSDDDEPPPAKAGADLDKKPTPLYFPKICTVEPLDQNLLEIIQPTPAVQW